ncbi:SNF2-related protein [Streptomyces sp. NPDC059740]|uniref:SNF2-related protein n=1 Tax=Streptomyces sp. NPDC059740 TaxID=3346926 RepID=UPI0036543587
MEHAAAERVAGAVGATLVRPAAGGNRRTEAVREDGRGAAQGGALSRCAAVFLPADPPRASVVAFWRPDGGPLPEAVTETPAAPARRTPAPEARPGPDAHDPVPGVTRLTVARLGAGGVRRQEVPALTLTVPDAVPLLARARLDPSSHPTAACWGAAVHHALHLAARGRLLPGLTGTDADAWRAGPWDAEDVAHARAVADALPPEGYAVPLPGSGPLRVPEPLALVRALCDAVVDALPRTPAAGHLSPTAFGAWPVHRLPEARPWAARVAAGTDAGVRLSLRLDLDPHRLYDRRAEDAAGPAADDGAPLPPQAAGPDAPEAGPDGSGPGSGDRAQAHSGGGHGPGGGIGDAPGEPPGVHLGTGPSRGAGPSTGMEERAAAAVVPQVHSLRDPTLLADAAELWTDEAPAGMGERARAATHLALRRAADLWPPLGRLLERPVPDVLPLSENELHDLLAEASPRLAAAGVAVHWPRDFARGLTTTAVVRQAPGTAADGFGFFDAGRLAEVRWRFDLDGVTLTEEEVDALAEAHRPLVRLRDQWVPVDPALVRRARRRELGHLAPPDALAAALSGTAELPEGRLEVIPTGVLAALRETLGAPPAPCAEPAGLTTTLRGYQRRGVGWLDRMTSLGLGGCLADDMGLGKTVTVIALHLLRRPTRPWLVVCPASLLGNWQREIERFAPGTAVHRFHGPGRSLAGVTDGFVLTTYQTMRSRAAELAGHRWSLVVADEAQHVKNARSATARALRDIPAPARVALTGTPVENNLSELWALLDWTTPGLLGPLTSFRALHARDVEGGEHPEAAARLARLVRPFVLRRTKSDPGIVPELPPKTETDHPVGLGREQAALYRAVVRETMDRIANARGMARRGLVMSLLTSLKQICNHPAQYLKETVPGLTARSGKLELLDELLDTVLAEGGAALVFTQYVEMARLLERHLTSRGVPVQLLHGGTPVAARQEMVDRFQSGAVPVFLLSLKAAGTGLNLTRAGHVIHYDRWWNPAVEDQATDRAYRIGQTQPVQVHRLVAEGTVEERIAELLTAKRALADAVLSGGEAALTELTDAELSDLVRLRRRP